MLNSAARTALSGKGRDFWWVAGCVAAAAAVRVGLLFTSLGEISSDEAVPGLQARHIWLLGERPVVDYENPPHGSMEMYLTAGLFALFGSSAVTLRLMPLLFGLAFVPLAYALGRTSRSRAVGRMSALYAALGPAILVIWQLKAGSGYVIVLAFGAGALLALWGIAYRGWGRPAYGVLGLLLGAGFWNHPVMSYFWAVAALMIGLVALERWRRSPSKPDAVRSAAMSAGIMLAGLGIGLAPLLAHNVATHWESIRAVARADAALPSPWSALRNVAAIAAPIMLGFTQPTSNAAEARRLIEATLWWHRLGTVTAVLLALTVLWNGRKSILQLARLRLPADSASPMLVLLVLTPLLFAVSRFRDFLTEPRYLLPIMASMPLVIGSVAGQGGRLRIAAGRAAIAAAIAINLAGIVRIDPALNLPWVEGVPLAGSNQELARFLDEQSITRFYGDYWAVYPVMFQSGERILGSAVRDGTAPGWNRYIPAAHNVSLAPDAAVVQVTGTSAEANFRRLLAEKGGRHNEDRVGAFTVFWAMEGRVFGF